MSVDFARRLKNPLKPGDHDDHIATPTDEQWTKGAVVVMKESYCAADVNVAEGDSVLMEQSMADRFVAAGYARFETDAERETAEKFGCKRKPYQKPKVAKPVSKESKSGKE